MNYLITAAGKGSRFIEKGINPPKPLVRVLGHELLLWSLNSFNFSQKDTLYLVTLKKHKVKERLGKKLNALYPFLKIFWLELQNLTQGQLITAAKAIEHFNIHGSLTIHNCDTYYSFQINQINSLIESDVFGIIPYFKSKGDHWSFVKNSISDASIATEVREKIRISDKCSLGTYVFSSCKQLMDLLNEYLGSSLDKQMKELYIAPIYQYAIEKKLKVKILEAKDIKVFGTPDELISNFDISFDALLEENGLDTHYV